MLILKPPTMLAMVKELPENMLLRQRSPDFVSKDLDAIWIAFLTRLHILLQSPHRLAHVQLQGFVHLECPSKEAQVVHDTLTHLRILGLQRCLLQTSGALQDFTLAQMTVAITVEVPWKIEIAENAENMKMVRPNWAVTSMPDTTYHGPQHSKRSKKARFHLQEIRKKVAQIHIVQLMMLGSVQQIGLSSSGCRLCFGFVLGGRFLDLHPKPGICCVVEKAA